MREIVGKPAGAGLRIAIVVARFNRSVTESLLDGALECLRDYGVADDAIDVLRGPGAFEVTVAAEQGVIGLLVHLALVVVALVTFLRGAGSDPVRVAVAAAFAAIVVHSLSYAAFFEDPLTWVLAAVGLAAVAGPAAVPAARPVPTGIPLSEP